MLGKKLLLTLLVVFSVCAAEAQLPNLFAPEDVNEWVTYENDVFKVSFPNEPNELDTLKLSFASCSVKDTVIELSFYMLDSAEYSYQSNFSEIGITKADPLGVAVAKTLMVDEDCEILALNNITLPVLGGLLNNTGKGYEIIHRYDAGSYFVLSFMRLFEVGDKVIFFSASAPESYVFSLSEYRTLFFNSVEFK